MKIPLGTPLKSFPSQLYKVQIFHKAHSLTSKHRISGVGCESALICPYMPLASNGFDEALTEHTLVRVSWWELVHDCHRVFKLWDLWARNLVLSSNTQGVRASHGGLMGLSPPVVVRMFREWTTLTSCVPDLNTLYNVSLICSLKYL